MRRASGFLAALVGSRSSQLDKQWFEAAAETPDQAEFEYQIHQSMAQQRGDEYQGE